MNFSEAMHFIEEKSSLGIKPGLERIKKLLEKMDNPQDKINIIHIAGTNGKGTVASTIAGKLTENGYKTGLFTSPWVVYYTEQIQVDGTFIDEQTLADYIDEYKDEESTEFELITAIMYKYFADNKVDYAVVECGMGGLGDATNTEKRNISVITSISLDHTNFFGSDIEAIAREKSGILRKDCPCILYPNRGLEYIFRDKCARLIEVEEQGSADLNNLATVNAVLRELNLPETESLVPLPARREKVNGIIVDGGHNMEAAIALEQQLDREVAVIAMLSDKDVEGYLSLIAPHCKVILATEVDHPRALSALALADIAEDYCDTVYIVDTPEEALKRKDITLICGSFYLARRVRGLIE